MTRAGFDDVVLLTGFPSFAARRLCEVLVGEGDRTFVHAIVPRASSTEAESALDLLPLEQRRRVNLIEGDPTAMDFGLAGAELRSLGKEIDRIHHVAQISAGTTDRKRAESVSLGGTRELLEVAAACPSLKCAVFHSSALVSGDRTGLVREEELDERQAFRSVFEETLARSEKLVRAAMPKLPLAVVRPTIILGDSQSGEVERPAARDEAGPYFLILLVLTAPPELPVPLPGRPDGPLHVVPVDHYVRVARLIGRDARAIGRTFHIGDPAPLTARRFFALVAQAGGQPTRRGFIPANLAKALLRTPGLERMAKSPRAFLDALATPVTYSLSNTDELLSGSGVVCPPLESYVEKLVAYVQQRSREPSTRDVETDDALDVGGVSAIPGTR